MEVERDQTVSSPKIPIIDLSNLNKEQVAAAVVKASQEWGVFQVVNHEIPKEVVQSLKKVGTQFFELSSETEKEAVAKPANSKDIQGYVNKSQKDGKDKVDRVDTLVHNLSPPSWVDYRYWPKNPPEYRQVNEEYARYVKKLAERILGWLSEGLGLEREALFNKGFGGGDKAVYTMQINYYPPCRPHANLVLGLHPHTDIHGLTILVPNEIAGLQVFKDDQWFDVVYNPSGILILIGDPIWRMSNGKYKNVLHRTILNKETRMSWVVLLKPTYDMVIEPLMKLTGDGDEAPKFKPITYGEHVYRKVHNLPLE